MLERTLLLPVSLVDVQPGLLTSITHHVQSRYTFKSRETVVQGGSHKFRLRIDLLSSPSTLNARLSFNLLPISPRRVVRSSHCAPIRVF